MMGAQRLDLSAGLAVPKSEIQTGVADGLGWAGGDLGLVGDAPVVDEEGRRLAETSRPKALTGLYSKLTSLAIGMGLCVFFQLYVHFHWKYRANKKYYERQKLTGTVKKIDAKVMFLNKEVTENVEFKKFPIVFVFPSIFLIVFKLFATGLVKNSFTLLITDACDSSCKTLAGFVFALCMGFLGLGWAVLTDFNVRYRKKQWKPAGKPPSAVKIDDPFYRGISMLRAKVFGMEDPRSIINRSQGKFGKPPPHMKGRSGPAAISTRCFAAPPSFVIARFLSRRGSILVAHQSLRARRGTLLIHALSGRRMAPTSSKHTSSPTALSPGGLPESPYTSTTSS